MTLFGGQVKFSYVGALVFFGILWLMVGIGLSLKGYQYGLLAIGADDLTSLIALPQDTLRKTEQSLMMMLSIGLMVGYLKGRFIMTRSVQRFMRGIVQLDEPLTIRDILTTKYLILIGCMMILGIILRYLPIPFSIKATVDFAVGVALLYGSFYTFQQARRFNKELP